MTTDQPTATVAGDVTAPMNATAPAGACVVPLSEEVTSWVVDTFDTNAAYLAWYDQQTRLHQSALALVAGVLDKIDAGWPVGAIEAAYAAIPAQRDILALYDHLTNPNT